MNKTLIKSILTIGGFLIAIVIAFLGWRFWANIFTPSPTEIPSVFDLECLTELHEDPSNSNRVTGWVCNEDCGVDPATGNQAEFYIPADHSLAIDTNEGVLFYWSREDHQVEITTTWYRLTVRNASSLETASHQFHQLMEYGKDPCNDGECAFVPIAVNFDPLP